MSERYGIKAYWGHRPDPADECARRAETFFRLLGERHSDFTQWYEKGNSAREALQLGFEPTRETFQRFFGREKYQLLDDGFAFGAWTGHVEQGKGGGVTLSCGSAAEFAPNYLWLSLPRRPWVRSVWSQRQLSQVLCAHLLLPGSRSGRSRRQTGFGTSSPAAVGSDALWAG